MSAHALMLSRSRPALHIFCHACMLVQWNTGPVFQSMCPCASLCEFSSQHVHPVVSCVLTHRDAFLSGGEGGGTGEGSCSILGSPSRCWSLHGAGGSHITLCPHGALGKPRGGELPLWAHRGPSADRGKVCRAWLFRRGTRHPWRAQGLLLLTSAEGRRWGGSLDPQ